MGLPFKFYLRLSYFALLLSAFSSAQNLASTDEATAFQQARAQTAPEVRISALTSYLDHFPSGSHYGVAQELLLKAYLNFFPDRTASIHILATSLINAASPGFERWREQATLADQLASAKPNGADLPDAQLWAQTALDSLTEPAYRHETTTAGIRYKLPKLTPRQMHEQFLNYRASFLAAAAHVALDQHQNDHAAQLLTEASHLNPLSPETNLLQAQLALANNQLQPALALFERAEALGDLDLDTRSQELQLFQHLNPGTSPESLDRQVDAVYRTLYPPIYTLAPRQLPAGGHTTLLELFTGSGCTPCAGPDLAVESLLATYTRQDLAILEFDEHIPRPDPLTTPDSVTRASFYNAETTPEAFLDGQPLQILGASRQDVENIVIGFADAIESQATLPSGLHLTASASKTLEGDIRAALTLTLTPIPNARPGETTGDTSLRALSRAQLFAALVQDNIRYSGENGIRVHRMVVRSLQHAPAATFLTGSQPHTLTFHPSATETANTAYLTDYQTTNDRFGTFHFATTDFPLNGGPLALVVWIQNPVTKEILQSIFAPVSPN